MKWLSRSAATFLWILIKHMPSLGREIGPWLCGPSRRGGGGPEQGQLQPRVLATSQDLPGPPNARKMCGPWRGLDCSGLQSVRPPSRPEASAGASPGWTAGRPGHPQTPDTGQTKALRVGVPTWPPLSPTATSALAAR